MRALLLERGRLRDAALVSVLAYAGLRPQEALALEWRHVRERTLLVERALSDGELKVLKNRRQPRTVKLLAPLRDDLADWRARRRPRRRRRSSRRRRAASGGPATGATGASASTGRSPKPSGSTAPARTTCATPSRRC